MKFSLILLTLFSASLYAQDCKPLNLITEANSPFNKLPVYDQDGIGICFAYSAAQLIDYHQIKKGLERSVHPLWAALKYTETERDHSKISSGLTFKTIDRLRKVGNCDYSKISGVLSEWAKKSNSTEAEVVSLIEILAPKLEELYDDVEEPSPTQIGGVITEAIKTQQIECRSSANFENLRAELQSLEVATSPEVLTKLILPACNKDLAPMDIPKTETMSIKNNADFLPNLTKKIEQVHAPISISYCSTVLFEPGYVGVKRGMRFNVEENCGKHESIVVGKKQVGNKCQVLVRNSWGSGWGDETNNWKCLCKNRTTGAFLDDCEKAKHNNGQFSVEACWIDSEALAKNTYRLTNIKPEIVVESRDAQSK